MARDSFTPRVWKGRRVKILAADRAAQEATVHQAIARRAYQLFERHDASLWHEAEDWRQAESELLHPLECSLMTHDDKVSICTDIAAFAEGDVEVNVEPRRLSLCGRPCSSDGGQGSSVRDVCYRLLDLPVEVDPSHVRARFNGRILELDLYRPPLQVRAA